MAANAFVRARVDQKTRDEAAAVLDELGLTVSDVIRMTLKRVANDHALPFSKQRWTIASAMAVFCLSMCWCSWVLASEVDQNILHLREALKYSDITLQYNPPDVISFERKAISKNQYDPSTLMNIIGTEENEGSRVWKLVVYDGDATNAVSSIEGSNLSPLNKSLVISMMFPSSPKCLSIFPIDYDDADTFVIVDGDDKLTKACLIRLILKDAGLFVQKERTLSEWSQVKLTPGEVEWLAMLRRCSPNGVVGRVELECIDIATGER